jgi:hypothetical protein
VTVVSGPLLAYAWYRQQIHDQYPDLVLYEPKLEDEVTIHDLVRHLIADNLEHRPVYATDPAEPWKAWFDFIKEKDAPVYRAVPRAPAP